MRLPRLRNKFKTIIKITDNSHCRLFFCSIIKAALLRTAYFLLSDKKKYVQFYPARYKTPHRHSGISLERVRL